MGWTYGHREQGQTVLDYLSDEFGIAPEGPGGIELLGHSSNISRTWLVLRIRDTGKVFAMEVLTHHVPRDYWNFGYKDLDESMGPSDVDIPARLFAMLDPADDFGEHSRDWRARVAARLARLADRPQVKAGDRVTFGGPLRFANGDTFTTMVYEGKGCHFRAGSWNGRYRLPRDWRTRYRYTVERADGRCIMEPAERT